MKHLCPICKSNDIVYLFSSEVPTLQNRVYDTRDEAIHCAKGTVDLTHCNNCNFTFNGGFDEQVIVYDEKYDNAVPSKLFIDYYHSICKYLYEKYNLENGIVYDIGCGKGTFLKILCALYPSVKGMGIDPSYEGDLRPKENLTFIRDFFKAEHVTDAPSLILSRHVFEHIEFPKDFLEIIREPVKSYPDLPFFIEVPDFGWIVEHKTFWDICYEHCNYFSQKSIEVMCENSWSTLQSITPAFSDQYLWVEGVLNETDKATEQLHFAEIKKAEIQDFVDTINSSRKDVLDLIQGYKEQNFKVIVWGMATKGVIFSNSIDRENKLIDYSIDINTEKQNKYAPLSAHFIQSPDVLSTIGSRECLVIIMNTNYSNEIKEKVSSYKMKTLFIDAHGNQL